MVVAQMILSIKRFQKAIPMIMGFYRHWLVENPLQTRAVDRDHHWSAPSYQVRWMRSSVIGTWSKCYWVLLGLLPMKKHVVEVNHLHKYIFHW